VDFGGAGRPWSSTPALQRNGSDVSGRYDQETSVGEVPCSRFARAVIEVPFDTARRGSVSASRLDLLYDLGQCHGGGLLVTVAPRTHRRRAPG
jgi:hypothetical protein